MTRPIFVVHPGAELYGSDRVLLDSVVGFIEAGHRVVVVLPEDGPLVDVLREAGAEVVITTALVLRKRLMRPSGWLELIGLTWRGAFVAWRLLGSQRPSAVYVSTITLPQWPLIARMRRVPVVLHVHEAEASASRIIKRILYAPALAAGRILVNSRFSEKVMTSAYARLAGRSIVVPNAVPGPVAPRAPRAELTGGLRVLFVGRLSPRKGVDLVVSAIELLEARGLSASLDIVGSVFTGYEWYEDELRAQSARLSGAVTFHGFQSDVWSFLDDADVLVVPSRLDEPFGNTAVEGVLARRPVIVSETSGLIEATAGIETALRVEPDSAESIAEALTRAIAEWPTLMTLVDAAAATAEDRHSVASYRERVTRYVTGPATDTA